MVVRVPKEENKHSPVRSPTPERLVNPPSGSVMSAIMTHVTDQANENEKERVDVSSRPGCKTRSELKPTP